MKYYQFIASCKCLHVETSLENIIMNGNLFYEEIAREA